MYKNKKVIVIIPARGGSKGIPNKNIQTVLFKPLIAYTIEEALKSSLIDKVIVSTDSLDIKSISEEYGADVPFLRPDNISTDYSKTIDSIIYTLDEIRKQGHTYDYVMTLQPTQPLRECNHINESLRLIIDNNWDSLVSISKIKVNPILIREFGEDKALKKILNTKSNIRRQEFKNYYKVNGSIYINKINSKFNVNTSLNDNQHGYLMDEEYDLDIDTFDDLERLNSILKSKNKNQNL